MSAAIRPTFQFKLIAWFIAAMGALVFVCAANGQATRPAALPTPVVKPVGLEARPLNAKPTESRETAAPSTATPVKAPDFAAGLDTTRVMAALVVVVGLIFLLRWLGQKYLGLPNVRGSGVVRVLSRSVVSPKQNVLLIQVGRRVLVVGENGTTLTPLSEIKDADEINALVGQLAEQRSAGPAAGTFGSVFSRARREFNDTTESDEPRALAEPATPDPNLNETRSELSGLLDKVRAVSRQIADR